MREQSAIEQGKTVEVNDKPSAVDLIFRDLQKCICRIAEHAKFDEIKSTLLKVKKNNISRKSRLEQSD